MLSLQAAGRRVELVTGQYTKRQATWFRHHALARQTRTFTINARFCVYEQFSESFWRELFHFIQISG
jgi:tRNA dimethylallyltransferase